MNKGVKTIAILLPLFLLVFKVMAQTSGTPDKWQVFTEFNSRYPGTHALALFIDKKGVLWIGTKGAGVIAYDGKSWVNYTKKNGLAANVVHAIAETESGMWFGTYTDGVSFFDGKNWTTYNTTNGMANDFVRAIAVYEDKIWFGTQGGVSMYDGKKWHKYTNRFEFEWQKNDWKQKRKYAVIEGLPLNEIWDLKITSDGKVWVGTYNGLARFNNVNWLTFKPPKDSMSDNEIKCLAADADGGLWIGTHMGGLIYFKDKKWTVFTTENGLGHNEVKAITILDKDVWVGTNGGGVSHYDGGIAWTTYTVKDGLSSNFVISLTSGAKKIWAGFYGQGIALMEIGP